MHIGIIEGKLSTRQLPDKVIITCVFKTGGLKSQVYCESGFTVPQQ